MKHKTEILGAFIGAIVGPAWPILLLFAYIFYLYHEGDWGIATFLLVSIIVGVAGALYYMIPDDEKRAEKGIRKPPVKGHYPQYVVPFIQYEPKETAHETYKGDLSIGAKLESCKMYLVPESIENRRFVFTDEAKKDICNEFHLPLDGDLSMQIGDNDIFYGISYYLFTTQMQRRTEIYNALADAKLEIGKCVRGTYQSSIKDNHSNYYWIGETIASDGNPLKMFIFLSMSREKSLISLSLSISIDDYERLDPEWVKDWK